MEHLDEFENFNEESIFEMANIVQEYTGLPMIIWISPKMSNHGPRIKAQNDYSNKVLSNKLFSITIEDSPRVIGDTGKLEKKDLELIKRFVIDNRSVLMDYWNGIEIDLFKVIKRFKKINESN